MDNLNTLTSPILSWLFNYVVHSSILLGFASLAQFCGVRQQRRLAELVWRLALFGGIITASLQLGWQLHVQTVGNKDLIHAPSQNIATSKPHLAEEVEKQVPTNAQFHSSALASPVRNKTENPIALNSHVNSQLGTQPDTLSDNTVLRLPAHIERLISAIISIWLGYCVVVLAKIMLGVHQLNRLANAMPLVSRKDLIDLLVKELPKSNHIQRLRVSTIFNSPFVCPNGMICLPAWALEQANQSLCHAMLHHEIRHIVRGDNTWRIAQEFIKSAFFFQVLNRAADKQLMLLAEIDCDSVAVRANGVDTFAQTLVRCAEKAVASKHPPFAIPMAKKTTLLQRIEFILDEDIMNKKFSRKHSASSLALGLITIASLSGVSYAMPTVGFAHSRSTNTSVDATVTTIQTPSASKEPAVLIPDRQTAPTDIARDTQTFAVESPVRQEKNQTNISKTSPDSMPVSHQQTNELEQAQTAYASKNFVEALSLFRELAKQGHVEAQFMAGDMLWRGEGSSVDPEAAMALLMQAANQGHAKAQQYAVLFAERALHQADIRFYTQQFDGGKLKWSEQVCARPTFSSMRPSSIEYKNLVNKLNANLSCYNNYVASLKQSLANEDFLNSNLRRLMRPDEIEQAKQLAQNTYFDMGAQAMQNSQHMLTEFDKLNQIWQLEIEREAGRIIAAKDDLARAHFARMERRQVEVETGVRSIITSSVPSKEPIINTK